METLQLDNNNSSFLQQSSIHTIDSSILKSPNTHKIDMNFPFTLSQEETFIERFCFY